MHPCFQDIFATHDEHLELRYGGTRQADRWADGVLKTPDDTVYARVQGGVPLFVPPDQDLWGDDETVAITLERDQRSRETLIPTNWQTTVAAWQQRKPEGRAWVERIAAQGGLTLIVACGPAGSHAPALLDLDPDTKLLMSDIGRWIVVDWQRFAGEQKLWPYLSCAQFDARRFPVRADSLDCVDSKGAMSEIENSSLTLQEAFRTLKSGGKLFLSEGMLDPECAQEFPEEGRRGLSSIGFTNARVTYDEQLCSIGFDIVSYQQWGPRTPDLGRSRLADIASKYGVQIRTYAVEAEAQKP